MSTYTYTARHADDPLLVVTFTLQDGSMFVDLGVPLEQIERVLQLRGAAPSGGGEHARVWLKPAAVSLLQRRTHPFSVADVYARAPDGGLWVTSWVRARGLRLAPITFGFSRVDNPEGALGFVRELERRRAVASRAGLPGPLDYWGSYALTASAAAGLLVAWGVRRVRGRCA